MSLTDEHSDTHTNVHAPHKHGQHVEEEGYMVVLPNMSAQEWTVMHPISNANLTGITVLLPFGLPQPALIAELARLALPGWCHDDHSRVYEGCPDVANVDYHQGHCLYQAVGPELLALVVHYDQDWQRDEVEYNH